jgi:hypothetical protein
MLIQQRGASVELTLAATLIPLIKFSPAFRKCVGEMLSLGADFDSENAYKIGAHLSVFNWLILLIVPF